MDRVCPLLAIAGDRRSVVDGVDSAHRCHAERPPAPLSRQEQAQLCLTAQHVRCERFRHHVATAGRGLPGRLSIGDGLVSTRMLLAPAAPWRGIAGRARTRARGRLAAGAFVVLAVGLAGAGAAAAVLSGALLPGDGRVAAATPSASAVVATPATTLRATLGAVASPTAVATPQPTATPQSTAMPTPAASTPGPTPAPPAPTPAPSVQTYVVEAGDTLAGIAQQFGTTVTALQAANGIEDPNEIVIGDVLVIP